MLPVGITEDKSVVFLNRHFPEPYNLVFTISSLPETKMPSKITVNIEKLFNFICNIHKLNIFLSSLEIVDLEMPQLTVTDSKGAAEMTVYVKLKYLRGQVRSEYSEIAARHDYIRFLALARSLLKLFEQNNLPVECRNLKRMIYSSTRGIEDNIELFRLAIQEIIKNK